MAYIEIDRCCDCATPAYPCRGRRCSNRHVLVHVCDACGKEIDEVFEGDGKELCEYCAADEEEED